MIKDKKFCVLAGGLDEFTRDYNKMRKEVNIIKEHISTQIVQIPNPAYMKGITLANVPEVVTSVYISGFFEIIDKENKKSTLSITP